MRFVKKVSERGVVTLPTEIREALGVEDGDLVEFEVLRVVRKANPGSRPIPTPSPSPALSPDPSPVRYLGGST